MKSERQRTRELAGCHDGRAFVEHGAAALAPLTARAHEGSPEVTGWCGQCQERAVPMRDGSCGFCGQPVTVDTAPGPEPEPAPVVELRAAPDLPPDLVLGDELVIPLDAATRSFALLAQKGAGKSNASAVMAEEMQRNGISWVAIDPKGDWWGLRYAEDGKSAGLPIVVFGGLHGDLPLPFSGAALATLIVERNLTCVVDLSQEDLENRPRWLLDFGDELFRLHGIDPYPRHVFIEEADEVVPEKGTGARGTGDTVRSWGRLVKQGRQRGLGVTLISQRSAAVNNNCLTQVDTLVALRTTGAPDRAAILKWIDFHSVARSLVDSLPSLEDGEGWVCSPQWLKLIGRRRFRRRVTFDSGATPLVEDDRRAVATIADLDLHQVSVELGLVEPPEPPETEDDEPSAIAAVVASPRSTILERTLDALEEGPASQAALAGVVGATSGNVGTALRQVQGVLAHRTGEMEARKGPPSPVWALGPGDVPSAPEEQTSDVDDALALVRGEPPPALAEIVARIDSELETAGIALLRGRYLLALLASIERGERDAALLDRFERVAGFGA